MTTTDGEGVLEARIPPNATTATLVVGPAEFPLRIGHLDPIDPVDVI